MRARRQVAPAERVPHELPAQKPGRSWQDYATPSEVIRAVERRFGRLDVDLAAHRGNAKAPVFILPSEDSFTVSWRERFRGKLCWLNPPFGDIGPWAERCAAFAATGQLRILLLTPASVGSEWHAKHVDGNALVLFMRGRVSFDGKAPYPKDTMLSCFGFGKVGYEVWDWRKE